MPMDLLLLQLLWPSLVRFTTAAAAFVGATFVAELRCLWPPSNRSVSQQLPTSPMLALSLLATTPNSSSIIYNIATDDIFVTTATNPTDAYAALPPPVNSGISAAK